MAQPQPDGHAAALSLEPPLLLRYLELAHKAGNEAGLRAGLVAARGIVSRASEWELVRLANAADRGKDSDLEAAALGALAARESLQPRVALHLVRKAHALGQGALAPKLADALAPKIAASRRAEFHAEALLIHAGPIPALAYTRQAGHAPRTSSEALLLGRMLFTAGRTRLARRYLRRCLRRWPNNVQLLQLYGRACLHSGIPEEALARFDALEAGDRDVDLTSARLHLLMESGRPDAALALAEQAEAKGGHLLQDTQKLRLQLALGHLEEAESLAAGAARVHWRGAKLTAHFSISDLGAKLNELRLYHVARGQGESQAALARRYFYPAQQAVEAWLDGEESRPPKSIMSSAEASSPIPRRIFQYWDKPEVPAEIAEVMASWSGSPGFDYVRLDRRGARAFLQESFGADHVRAFDLARNAAEECDLLRLCWMLVHGGSYADADDLLTGDLSRLLPPGKGLVLYREPYGAIQNNFFSARPGHPVLRFAVDEACRAMLRGDNDWTWSKTGPGLLTRAAASWILENDESVTRRDLLVLPRHALYAEVHPHVQIPYKKTPAYWNAGGARTSRVVVEALSAALGDRS